MPTRSSIRRYAALTLACFGLVSLAACTAPGFVPERGLWGADATLAPSGARLLQSGRAAFIDPWTWVPIAGAAVVAVADVDRDITRWATRHNPVFGNEQRALSRSGQWKKYLHDATDVTTLAAGSGDERGAWMRRKAIGFSALYLAEELRGQITTNLKRATDRTRFDGSDDESFPSGHTSSAFVAAGWNDANLDFMDLPGELRTTLRVANRVGAVGVGWARIEGGRHFATDILVGAAIGNAAAVFFQNAFVGVPGPGDPRLSMNVSSGEWTAGLRWSF